MGGGIGFSLPVSLGAWQLNGAQANLGVWFSRGGKVRGNPCNALLGLGATKRRGILSMTERHFRTLPLKDIGKKGPTNRTLYDARHVALAFCLDNIQQNKQPRFNPQLQERNLEGMIEANLDAVKRGMEPPYDVDADAEKPDIHNAKKGKK